MADALYETDFYAWTMEQAARLRAGDATHADLAHIAEELETMGRSEKRALASLLTNLLCHLLKYDYQPTHRPPSWRLTIANARDDLADLLADNPSLRPRLAELTTTAYPRARRQGRHGNGAGGGGLSG